MVSGGKMIVPTAEDLVVSLQLCWKFEMVGYYKAFYPLVN